MESSRNLEIDFVKIAYSTEMYGSRIVPGKKYISSGGRHLIYVAAATLFLWRPPLNYLAAAT